MAATIDSDTLAAIKRLLSGYFGKYRGFVRDNADPLRQGRIRALIPDVLGEATSDWALPCVPFSSGPNATIVLPPVGAPVWIEFESGRIEHPIWSGTWIVATGTGT